MEFEITGMRCASCAARVETAIKKVAGDTAVVNFATHRARVGPGVNAAAVIAAVTEVGYQAKPLVFAGEEQEEGHKDERHSGLMLPLVLGIPVTFIGMVHLTATWALLVSSVLTAAMLVGPGRGYFLRAWSSLRRGAVGMDLLVAIGSSAAMLASLGAWFMGGHEVYFEAAAATIMFLSVGQFIETKARRSSLAAIDRVRSLASKEALLLEADGRERLVPTSAIKIGDRLVIRPGEKVAVDARIVDGSSLFDESLVTGESVAVAKGYGDQLVGATINSGGGRVVAQATAGAEGSVVGRVAAMVDEANTKKAKMQRLADQLAAYFVPVVLLLALVTLVYVLLTKGWDSYGLALQRAVAVLVVACPCALGLATPMAILVATGTAARRLILIRGVQGIERAGKVNAVVVDKTGTLTEGRPQVVEVIYREGIEPMVALGAAAAAEQSSLHPLAMAIRVHAEHQGITLPQVVRFHEVTGIGVEATVLHGGAEILCHAGRLALLRAQEIPIPESWSGYELDPRSLVYVAINRKAAAVFFVEDKIRDTSASAVAAMTKMGIEVVMATGDRRETAERVAEQLGIKDVRFGLNPGDKVKVVEGLKAKGKIVAVLGDGVNDAPALAAADVGIAVGNGADIAIDAAHFVLPRGDMQSAVVAIRLASKTAAVMRQNLGWAFVYNAAVLPLAAAGMLSPMVASVAMALSSFSVVANSLRLAKAPG